MMFWGKLVGAVFGLILLGPFGLGLIGLLLGGYIGHQFDKGLLNLSRLGFNDKSQAQRIFFKITFGVMGHVAKADGRVSEDEIRLARKVMRQMNLSQEQTQQAIRYFHQGKEPQFDLDAALNELLNACGSHAMLLRMFVDLQHQAALADKVMGPNKARILNTLCLRLGFQPIFGQRQHQRDYSQQHSRPQFNQRNELQNAYALLEVDSSAEDHEVKKKYRKLMSQNHPDKLMSQGLPEEMIKLATDKTQKIQKAFETIKQSRGMR